MHKSDLRKLTTSDLAQQEQDLRRELMGLRFKHATGELENTSQLQATRRKIARVVTLIKEQQNSERVKG